MASPPKSFWLAMAGVALGYLFVLNAITGMMPAIGNKNPWYIIFLSGHFGLIILALLRAWHEGVKSVIWWLSIPFGLAVILYIPTVTLMYVCSQTGCF